MNCILRLIISLLLVFCTLPAVDQCTKDAALSLEQGSTMAYSAQVIMEPAVVSIDLGQRATQKYSDNVFQYFTLPTNAPNVSPRALTFVPFYIIDRFANIIGLKAIALRAPPSL